MSRNEFKKVSFFFVFPFFNSSIFTPFKMENISDIFDLFHTVMAFT